MRIVPPSPTLKPVPRKCSTKFGRSLGLFKGSHSTAWPVSPAIDVKVPHSCAIRPLSMSTFCALPASDAQKRKAEKNTQARRNEPPAGVRLDKDKGRESCDFIAALPSFHCPLESFPTWSGSVRRESGLPDCV